MKNLFNGMEKRKLIFVGTVGVVIIFLIITILILLISALTGNSRSYSSAEKKLVSAAKDYYSDNEKKLPQELDAQITITANQLTVDKYLTDLAKLVPEGATCSGKVVVTKVNSSYNYTAYLDCGDDYKTTEISNKIINSVNTVAEGVGLYQMNGEYVYRGETPNNYLTFAGELWRIVKIDRNNRLVLILDDPTIKSTWDNRYNIDRDQEVGINDYKVSRVYEALLTMYNGDDYFKESDKLSMSMFDACIGKRSSTSAINDGSTECTTVLENQNISLLPLYDFINASLDTECITGVSENCQNYNYLTIFAKSWWTLTATNENTYKSFKIESSGNPRLSQNSTLVYARPIITLLSSSMYKAGDGTLDNPYTIK